MAQHASSFFQANDGVRLYWRGWGTPQKGVVVLIHGFAEHVGRYRFLTQALSERGYRVEGFDCRGHGQSGGQRGHIRSFDQYLEDLGSFLTWVRQRHPPPTPLFLLGHSQGGHIALRYGLQNPKAVLHGVIVSSPFLGMRQAISIPKRIAARVSSTFWPTYREENQLHEADLTHDLAMIEETKSDPLYGRVVTARWYRETKRAIRHTLKNASRFRYPLLFQVAGEDRIVDPEAGRLFYDRLKNSNKQWIEYPGYFHEIYNETPDRRGPVFEDLGAWLDDHLPPSAR